MLCFLKCFNYLVSIFCRAHHDHRSFACEIQRLKSEHACNAPYFRCNGNCFRIDVDSYVRLVADLIKNGAYAASRSIPDNVHFRAYFKYCFDSVPKRCAVALNVSFDAVFVTCKKDACAVSSYVAGNDDLVARLCVSA